MAWRAGRSCSASIRRRRLEFEAADERAEKLRTLPGETVATLRAMGAFWLKTPAELGGTPLAPLDFCDVMEEFGYADAATAWTVMVGNGGTGTAGGWLPDAGAGRVFAPGRPLPLVVGTPGPRGTGRAAPGGYVVSGRWGFASGVAYADWLLGGFRVPGGGGLPDRLLVAVVPKDDVEVVDTWHVAGLQGSGSFDFRMADVFVPAEMTFERAASACRGGALFARRRTCSCPTRCRRCASASRAARSTRWLISLIAPPGSPAARRSATARCSARSSAGLRRGCARPGWCTGTPLRPPSPPRTRATISAARTPPSPRPRSTPSRPAPR